MEGGGQHQRCDREQQKSAAGLNKCLGEFLRFSADAADAKAEARTEEEVGQHRPEQRGLDHLVLVLGERKSQSVLGLGLIRSTLKRRIMQRIISTEAATVVCTTTLRTRETVRVSSLLENDNRFAVGTMAM